MKFAFQSELHSSEYHEITVPSGVMNSTFGESISIRFTKFCEKEYQYQIYKIHQFIPSYVANH